MFSKLFQRIRTQREILRFLTSFSIFSKKIFFRSYLYFFRTLTANAQETAQKNGKSFFMNVSQNLIMQPSKKMKASQPESRRLKIGEKIVAFSTRVRNFRQKNNSAEDGIDGKNGYFRLFHRTENSRNYVPNHSAVENTTRNSFLCFKKQKQTLGMLFRTIPQKRNQLRTKHGSRIFQKQCK